MANAVRVRVELRENRYMDAYERDIAFRKLWTAFKKQCTDAGVAHEYKQHESFESDSRKRRRKRSESARLKEKLKENFTISGKKAANE